MYGKFNEKGTVDITDGRIIKKGNTVIANPNDEMLRKLGYKKIVESEIPKGNASYRLVYRENENNICISYEEE